MSEMVERVAKAIFKQAIGHEPVGDEMPPHWLDHARAAIEAMREPTIVMCEAGETPKALAFGSYSTWQAMIDAALAGSK